MGEWVRERKLGLLGGLGWASARVARGPNAIIETGWAAQAKWEWRGAAAWRAIKRQGGRPQLLQNASAPRACEANALLTTCDKPR